MKRNDPVRNIMSAETISVNVSQKLSEVRRLMAEKRIHHVPVVSGKKLVGLLSATDMVRLSLSAYGADERAIDAMLDHEFTIEKEMNKDLVTVSETAMVRDAAEKLKTGTFHSLPVVNGDGDMVGIVTSTDLIKYLLDQY